jgi:hypothetical protein
LALTVNLRHVLVHFELFSKGNIVPDGTGQNLTTQRLALIGIKTQNITDNGLGTKKFRVKYMYKYQFLQLML